MKAIFLWVLFVVIVLISCGNQSDKKSDVIQPSDVSTTHESTKSVIVSPDMGTPPPHPELTPEESERLFRLKGKGSPWKVEDNISHTPGQSLPSEEKTELAPGNKNRKAVE